MHSGWRAGTSHCCRQCRILSFRKRRQVVALSLERVGHELTTCSPPRQILSCSASTIHFSPAPLTALGAIEHGAFGTRSSSTCREDRMESRSRKNSNGRASKRRQTAVVVQGTCRDRGIIPGPSPWIASIPRLLRAGPHHLHRTGHCQCAGRTPLEALPEHSIARLRYQFMF